jgi:hypothetical protein
MAAVMPLILLLQQAAASLLLCVKLGMLLPAAAATPQIPAVETLAKCLSLEHTAELTFAAGQPLAC